MVGNLLKKVFGSRNERQVKRYRKLVAQTNALEESYQGLTDAQLQAKTEEFKQRLANGESLESLLPEAFAPVREASSRVLNMRHFDVQLIGGMVLNEGKISEMRTGEGKTLVATLPAYLNGLTGNGVHVITVNDYLAQRDANWMGKLYTFLGLTVGVVVANQSSEAKREAYNADITYGTNNEFGFDYLRDNMAFSSDERVQRPLNYAIVDEVDSILIDEARTPLIISGPAEDNAQLYTEINKLIPLLKRQEGEEDEIDPEFLGDYTVDEKSKQVHLTEQGHEHVEELLIKAGLLDEEQSLYDTNNIALMHHVNAGLRAHALFTKNVDYIVKNDEVIIVDEFTGRTMAGRRWSEGLHQAIEAKEGVPIQQENQTLASITFQNYFRLYEKLSGMTGTADTEAFEFQQIYGLEVVVIPTNNEVQRKDFGDLIYMSQEEKFEAIVEDIRDCQERKQPVLVGTASIEMSEVMSDRLTKAGISHEVLNAKNHAREADIIAQAGRPGAVTIATNMAGRGTDIVLGGNLDAEIAVLDQPDQKTTDTLRQDWQKRHDAVLASGGLHIIGTERHESRRIDNQLRGRAGRQGDPGSTRFYLSLEDPLMRIFASDKIGGLMKKLGMKRGEAIEHPWVTKSIENAQRKVEGHNFDIRKQLLEYDDVANDQRKVIYEQRNDLMVEDDISDTIVSIREDVVNAHIDQYIPPQSLEEQWDVKGLEESLHGEFGASMPIQQWLDEDDNLHEENLREKIVQELVNLYNEKEQQVGFDAMRRLEKGLMLQILDSLWKEHLAAMDYLRKGIHLRGYAQKNPKQEYKREAFEMFTDLLERIKHDTITMLSRLQIQAPEEVEQVEQHEKPEMQYKHESVDAIHASADSAAEEGEDNAEQEKEQPFVRSGQKVGRNDPCPCGSGKKYKQCHGKLN